VSAPAVAFVERFRRRLQPEFRVVPGRILAMLVVGWVLAVTCLGALLAVGWVLVAADAPRQVVLDTAASLGVGTARPDTRVAGISCSFHRDSGRLAMNEHRCSVRVQDGRDSLRLDLRTAEPLTRPDAGPVVGVLGQVAIPWPAGVMWGRWVRMLPFALAFGLLVPLAWAGLSIIRRTTRQVRAITRGELLPADLLCRRVGKGANPIIRWDIAYDQGGRRRRARIEAPGLPILLDGLATRGVVLGTPGGAVEILQAGGWPLTLDLPTATWLTDSAEALRLADRPLAPDLAAVAQRLPEGTERAYVTAFDRLWHAETHELSRTAMTQLHAAAARLAPARVDALLQSLRAALP
jgi:hypothetical protein